MHCHLAVVGTIERAQDVKECTLACAGCANNCNQFALVHRKVNPFEHIQLTIALRYLLSCQHMYRPGLEESTKDGFAENGGVSAGMGQIRTRNTLTGTNF